jgi:hypothetical protein
MPPSTTVVRLMRRDAPADVATLLREVVAEQARQRQMLAEILRLLERGRGARDEADQALLLALAEAVGDRQFTSAQLMAHAAVDPALHEALEAADVTSTKELGCLCRRLEGISIRGVRLARAGDQRGGVLWRLLVCEV